jgi:hypothetical protein
MPNGYTASRIIVDLQTAVFEKQNRFFRGAIFLDNSPFADDNWSRRFAEGDASSAQSFPRSPFWDTVSIVRCVDYLRTAYNAFRIDPGLVELEGSSAFNACTTVMRIPCRSIELLPFHDWIQSCLCDRSIQCLPFQAPCGHVAVPYEAFPGFRREEPVDIIIMTRNPLASAT